MWAKCKISLCYSTWLPQDFAELSTILQRLLITGLINTLLFWHNSPSQIKIISNYVCKILLYRHCSNEARHSKQCGQSL
jgi:hypothetical protein